MSTDKTRTLRSRHPRYRWRGVRFENNVAQVTPAQAEAAKTDPFFGQWRDFWEDAPAASVGGGGGGGKNEVPKVDDPIDEDSLAKLNKSQLQALATDRGVEFSVNNTKAELIEAILPGPSDT